MAEFKYQDPFPLSGDDTQYRLLTKNYISTTSLDGEEILKIDPEGLAFLANQAMRDVSFMLRPIYLIDDKKDRFYNRIRRETVVLIPGHQVFHNH